MKTLHSELGVGAPAPIVWQVLADAVLWRNRMPIETGFQAMNRALKREAERVARERA